AFMVPTVRYLGQRRLTTFARTTAVPKANASTTAVAIATRHRASRSAPAAPSTSAAAKYVYTAMYGNAPTSDPTAKSRHRTGDTPSPVATATPGIGRNRIATPPSSPY